MYEVELTTVGNPAITGQNCSGKTNTGNSNMDGHPWRRFALSVYFLVHCIIGIIA